MTSSQPHPAVIEEARKAAYLSPCWKSARGVVVFRPREIGRSVALGQMRGTWLLAHGYNGPPSPFVCDRSESCMQDCSKTCVHAEQRAISDLIEVSEQSKYTDLDMLHVKVVDGIVVPSGPPQCWQCSRAILDAGIGGMWLYEGPPESHVREPGWYRYTALEFHKATLTNCGMPEAARRIR